MKNNPKDYVWIARWGYHLGSFEYYIKDQQDLVAAEDAPLNAIYKRDGVWHTVDDVVNPETRRSFESRYDECRGPGFWNDTGTVVE